MMDNFFNDEIEKTVFISDEQLKNAVPGKLYGKYFEDTRIYNILPQKPLPGVLPVGNNSPK